ncbi:MAG: retroviral-like aspartic protease family protein, partial [Gammaproteobacteria bacterium]
RGLVETASGPADAYGVRFDEVRVRGLVARNIRGVVIESDSPREALLGQVFLNRFDLRREGPVLELEER